MQRLPVLGSTLILTVVLTGCLGDDGGQPESGNSPSASRPAAAANLRPVTLPDDPAALAALLDQRVRTQPSVRININTVTTAGSGKATMDMSGSVRNPTGTQTAASLKIVETGPDAGTGETVVLPREVYVKSDGEPYEPGKPWLRITQADLAKPDLGGTRKYFLAAYNEAQQGLREASANKGLALLRYGKPGRAPVWETLGSVKVRRYDGSTDTETLGARTGEQQFKDLSAAGVRGIPWAVWVDQYGLLRQITFTMASSKTTINTKVGYSGWGEPVTVNPPPAQQVATLNP